VEEVTASRGDRIGGDRVEGDRIEGDRIEGDRIEGDRIEGVVECGGSPIFPGEPRHKWARLWRKIRA
jgi:hypothetical protein